MNIEKKEFVEPICNVEAFEVADVITTSEDNWGGGEF